MVRKIMKHEMFAYLRMLLPAQLILIAIALISRFILFFESDNSIFGLSYSSSVIIFILASIVLAVMTFVICLVRFYKNLFSLEGYLTFTLPAKTSQLIWTKLLLSFIFTILSVIVIFLSFCIVMSGDVLVEVFKAIGYLFGLFFKDTGVHGGFYIAEVIVLMLVSIFTSYLLWYACFAVGQLTRKNRVLLSFGVYFGYYFACQILGTIMMIIFSILAEKTTLFEGIISFIDKNPHASAHIFFVVSIVWTVILGIIYYAVPQHIIKKKLNLE